MTDPNCLPNPAFQPDKKEATPQDLAEEFAAQAVKAALAPALDGLNILDEIRRGFPNTG